MSLLLSTVCAVGACILLFKIFTPHGLKVPFTDNELSLPNKILWLAGCFILTLALASGSIYFADRYFIKDTVKGEQMMSEILTAQKEAYYDSGDFQTDWLTLISYNQDLAEYNTEDYKALYYQNKAADSITIYLYQKAEHTPGALFASASDEDLIATETLRSSEIEQR